MSNQQTYRNQRGFTITELMLVLGVGAVIIAGAFIGYKTVSDDQKTQSNGLALTQLAAKIRGRWSLLGDYSSLSESAVNAGGLIEKPLTWTGTHIYNAWDRVVRTFGSSSSAVVATRVPGDACLNTIVALDAVAYRLDVGTAWPANADIAEGADTIKAAGAAIDAAAATARCAAGGGVSTVSGWIR